MLTSPILKWLINVILIPLEYHMENRIEFFYQFTLLSTPVVCRMGKRSLSNCCFPENSCRRTLFSLEISSSFHINCSLIFLTIIFTIFRTSTRATSLFRLLSPVASDKLKMKINGLALWKFCERNFCETRENGGESENGRKGACCVAGEMRVVRLF